MMTLTLRKTVESLYLMWKTTGDEIWRERGYKIYQAIEKHTKAPYGYTSVSNVDTAKPTQIDEMPRWVVSIPRLP
jgi:mannosyl-oligosaccharide alpha-1,2-mannosidase